MKSTGGTSEPALDLTSASGREDWTLISLLGLTPSLPCSHTISLLNVVGCQNLIRIWTVAR